MKDEQIITLRLTLAEKEKIKEEASQSCMSINQYIKYKVLESETQTKPDSAVMFLNKNFALFSRILISGYMHTRLLGIKHFTKDELARINEDSSIEFQKLGIEKPPSLADSELRRAGEKNGSNS